MLNGAYYYKWNFYMVYVYYYHHIFTFCIDKKNIQINPLKCYREDGER